jgi:hypothetical protein
MLSFHPLSCHAQYHNGKHVRDLSKLNRDLGQVLFISGEGGRHVTAGFRVTL